MVSCPLPIVHLAIYSSPKILIWCYYNFTCCVKCINWIGFFFVFKSAISMDWRKYFTGGGGGLELYLPVEETSRSDSRLWIFYWRLTGVWSSQLNNSENSTFWNISLKIHLDLHIRISRIRPKLWGCRVKEHVKKS